VNGFDGHLLKVLVVDDNEHFRHLVRTVLQAVNIRDVAEAATGAEALEHLRAFAADLCITDWRMPEMDGLAFILAVRRAPDSPNPYLPIIMCSGYAEAGLVLEARQAGVTEFLAKPISARSLLTRVLSVVRNPRPFVRAGDYFGPDRRRRQVDHCGVERRHADPVP
jgi:CheY-like chemotaxis protein